MSAVDVDEILEHQLNANMLLMPYHVYSDLFDSIDSLGVELDKLRELVGMIGNVCDGTSEVCKYCKNYSATNDECMMLKQMRELGIEVASV